MRIAIVHWSRRKVGGAETYVSAIIPELHRLGYEVALWHEIDQPANREQIDLPDGAPAWCVADLGTERALAALRDWHPDLIYAHGLLDPELEAETLKIAPAIFYAHGYYGTCISGAKTFKSPLVTPCSRRFGWQCLLHYYPRRCGGLDPVTMLKRYRLQSKRLGLLSTYKAIVTASAHMRSEYLKHGFPPHRVYDIPQPVVHDGLFTLSQLSHSARVNREDADDRLASEYRLLFLGRMDLLKGGHVFIDALPYVCKALDRPLRVIFAGDGPKRRALECQGANVQARTQGLQIEFAGWLDNSERDLMFTQCDLLVVPSLWPEPFGLVGVEAMLYRTPVAAFTVGGIPDWLADGGNGFLAPGNPPTAMGLAEAIIKCLSNRQTYARLRQGAAETARRFSMHDHLRALVDVFKGVLQQAVV